MAARRRKTEVYFEAIAAALPSAAVLCCSRIALTAQWLKRFEDRFGALPAPWHSGLTSLERASWRAIEGRCGSWSAPARRVPAVQRRA